MDLDGDFAKKCFIVKNHFTLQHSPVSYCVCDDACVRLICPVTGELITVFMTPNHESIQDAVYHIAEGKKLSICHGAMA